jgi:hypothetical protein
MKSIRYQNKEVQYNDVHHGHPQKHGKLLPRKVQRQNPSKERLWVFEYEVNRKVLLEHTHSDDRERGEEDVVEDNEAGLEDGFA